MSIERTWRCDARDCDHHAGPFPHPNPPPGFLTLHEGVSTQDRPSIVGVFCSRECVMRFAAQTEPPEVI